MTLDEDLAAARAAMPDTSGIEPIALRMRCLSARKNGDELAMRINDINNEMSHCRTEFTALLAQTYLPGVGTVVCVHFIEAMRGYQADTSGPWTARSLHDHFRAHSAALGEPEHIGVQAQRSGQIAGVERHLEQLESAWIMRSLCHLAYHSSDWLISTPDPDMAWGR